MNSYLLDTMIVSEATKPHPSPQVVAWLSDRRNDELRVSALTFAEIYGGIENLAHRDILKSRRFLGWAAETERLWASRIIGIDMPIAKLAGPMLRRLPSEPIDALIGATALVHGLTVATRNVRHFRLFDVPVVDPYA
jgi:toxin FitB